MSNASLDETLLATTPEARSGDYVCLSVADTGAGIPPESLDRIFDPFFTTKEVGQGTGLGLATVQGIVRGHGGFVKVKSQVGQGTMFEIYLPASPTAPAAIATERATPLRRGAGELILVVDDEASVRDIAQRLLTMGGYQVLTAANGAEALASFAQRRTDIRLVLTDMMMPVMGGVALVRNLQRLEPCLPIVAMTGLVERANITELNQLDLAAGLNKPFTLTELLDVVHRVRPRVGDANALAESRSELRRKTLARLLRLR